MISAVPSPAQSVEARFEEYSRFKDTYRNRSGQYAHLMAEEVGRGLTTPSAPYVFEDIGSGDGKAAIDLLNLLLDGFPLSEITLKCYEPSSIGRGRIRSRAARNGVTRIEVLDGTIEELASTREASVADLVTSAHVLYHVPVSSWGQIIQAVNARLRPNGVAAISLANKDNWYHTALYARIPEIRRFQDSSIGGAYVFSAELKPFIEKVAKDSVLLEDVDSLVFGADDIRDLLQPTAALDASNPLMRSICFLLRLDIEAIDSSLKLELARRSRESLAGKSRVELRSDTILWRSTAA